MPGLGVGHPDRTQDEAAAADLIRFPTGGGKTEAYLGVAAYALALRRLEKDRWGRDGRQGVAVLMRYTLRLLTLQQFQRAAALICACESIRNDPGLGGHETWGDEPFRIGLWVGMRTTPNRTDAADEALKQIRGAGDGYKGGLASPAQLTFCPWCGWRLDAGQHYKVRPFKSDVGRTLVHCGNRACALSERNAPGEGIPVVLVDEELYRHVPALVIATVDKFAQMPWNGATQTLFGQVAGYCTRHGFRSPTLSDDRDSHPSRGGLPAASTVPAGPLRPPDLVIQDELHLISGPLGTLVGYFNSIRELAGMRRLSDDDVRSRLRRTDLRGLARRTIYVLDELTSRKQSDEIPKMLDQLEAVFDPAIEAERKEARKARRKFLKKRPYDVLLATNMVSVGVDVKRLGLMVVGGQPKTTAEYIQASSRVGRNAPGLVVTVYNWARPRDLSHYERFGHYHDTFYQHVEALSVTPFAPRAIDRGLSALLVSLVRLPGVDFNPNHAAHSLEVAHALVQAARDRIARRAACVSGSNAVGDEVSEMVQARLDLWMAEIQRDAGGSTLGYKRKKDGSTRALLQRAGDGPWQAFTCLNSLRDVEAPVPLLLDESGMDEGSVYRAPPSDPASGGAE